MPETQALRRWVGEQFPFLCPLLETKIQVSGREGGRVCVGEETADLFYTCQQFEWAGYLTETADYLPLLGRMPGRSKVWVCGGFNGHGMPVGAAMACDCLDLALADKVSV